jgi:hypothetical protein
MTSSRHPDKLFKYRHFDRQIIVLVPLQQIFDPTTATVLEGPKLR